MHHSYTLTINDSDKPAIYAAPGMNGGRLVLDAITFFTDDMAHLADVLEAASKAARAVAADQQYEQGEAS